jgi:hypothetical protein
MDNKRSGFESQHVLTEVWACGVMVAQKRAILVLKYGGSSSGRAFGG